MSDTKLKELILHIATQCASDSRFGSVKLNKILFYADFLSYLKRGQSITGQEYFAIREGPAPKRMKHVIDQMVDNGELAYQEIEVGLPNRKKKPIALRLAEYSYFNAEDIVIADDVIKKLWSKNGSQVSDMSHNFAGWIAAMSQGEKTIIPYEIVRFDTNGFWGIEMPPLPRRLVDHGKELAKRLGKLGTVQRA